MSLSAGRVEIDWFGGDRTRSLLQDFEIEFTYPT